MCRKVVLVCCLLLFLLTACGPADSSTSSHSSVPVLITARSVRGMPGNGPIIVSLSGGDANNQQVVLKDRILVFDSLSKQDTADGHASKITLELTVRNTSDKPIMNQLNFFQLMSREGDTFAYQDNSSDHFYDLLSAHSSRNGTVVFQIPKAAATQLQLLYHPEVATESVLMLLKL
jgi:hypothetical protein